MKTVCFVLVLLSVTWAQDDYCADCRRLEDTQSKPAFPKSFVEGFPLPLPIPEGLFAGKAAAFEEKEAGLQVDFGHGGDFEAEFEHKMEIESTSHNETQSSTFHSLDNLEHETEADLSHNKTKRQAPFPAFPPPPPMPFAMLPPMESEATFEKEEHAFEDEEKSEFKQEIEADVEADLTGQNRTSSHSHSHGLDDIEHEIEAVVEDDLAHNKTKRQAVVIMVLPMAPPILPSMPLPMAPQMAPPMEPHMPLGEEAVFKEEEHAFEDEEKSEFEHEIEADVEADLAHIKTKRQVPFPAFPPPPPMPFAMPPPMKSEATFKKEEHAFEDEEISEFEREIEADVEADLTGQNRTSSHSHSHGLDDIEHEIEAVVEDDLAHSKTKRQAVVIMVVPMAPPMLPSMPLPMAPPMAPHMPSGEEAVFKEEEHAFEDEDKSRFEHEIEAEVKADLAHIKTKRHAPFPAFPPPPPMPFLPPPMTLPMAPPMKQEASFEEEEHALGEEEKSKLGHETEADILAPETKRSAPASETEFSAEQNMDHSFQAEEGAAPAFPEAPMLPFPAFPSAALFHQRAPHQGATQEEAVVETGFKQGTTEKVMTH